jgi:hypothetical protein
MFIRRANAGGPCGVVPAMEPTKRGLRNLKRQLKQKGGKRRRAALKRDLAANPEDPAMTDADFDFGRASSADYNGMDNDATRRDRDDG